MWFGLKPANCVQVRLLNTSTLNADLHLLYRDVTLAVWARLRPHGTIHILVSPHEQELDVLATLCALDVTVFTDLTVGLQCKHQSRHPVMLNQLWHGSKAHSDNSSLNPQHYHTLTLFQYRECSTICANKLALCPAISVLTIWHHVLTSTFLITNITASRCSIPLTSRSLRAPIHEQPLIMNSQ